MLVACTREWRVEEPVEAVGAVVAVEAVLKVERAAAEDARWDAEQERARADAHW